MIAYFDMFSGVAGDMILGALVDAGLDPADLRDTLAGLPVGPFALRASRVRRGGLAATLAAWEFRDEGRPRGLPEIERLVRAAGFHADVERPSLAIFRRLAAAEARVHGVPLADVHLHEAGAVDAILDVCGAASALHLLGVDRVEASAFRTGSGYVRAGHGLLPVPAPAVVALVEGWRLEPLDAGAELTTPTGAAVVTTLAPPPGGPPALLVRSTGYGAGARDGAQLPNCLRVLLGEAPPAGRDGWAGGVERLMALETNIDDMSPQLYGWLEERLFEAGAREVFFTPATMRRGRPGTLVSCLADEGTAGRLEEVLFRETTTLGVRSWPLARRALPRREERARTSLGEVRVKRVRGAGGREELRPEYEECRRLARELGLPLRQVTARLERELEEGDAAAAPGGGGRPRNPLV